VLEFGAGIGTITYLLLSVRPEPNLIAVDANEFCLEQLERNIPDEFRSRLKITRLGDPLLA